jgi:hypothetical protein
MVAWFGMDVLVDRRHLYEKAPTLDNGATIFQLRFVAVSRADGFRIVCVATRLGGGGDGARLEAPATPLVSIGIMRMHNMFGM